MAGEFMQRFNPSLVRRGEEDDGPVAAEQDAVLPEDRERMRHIRGEVINSSS